MKKIITKLLLSLAIILNSASAINVYANDKAPESIIAISPMNQKIILVPGETYVGSIDVTNPNVAEQNLKYSAEIGPFNQESDTYESRGDVLTSEKTKYNMIMDWIELERDNGVISPNNTDKLVFRIVVPEDAPAGGQYAAILVKNEDDTIPSSTNNSAQIGSVVQMASIIYAEVAGETREEGTITENNIPSFLMGNILEAASMVRNNGNVHTDAKYTLQVWPMFSDEEICTNEEEPETSLVMPETERYHTQTCTLPPVGIFRAKQTVKIFGEVSELEKTITVCPLWLLFIIIFAIAVLIIWLVVKAKGRKTSRK